MSAAIHSLAMPKWGMTMTEGTLVAWLAEEGDEIASGQAVAEVETDKMVGEVEAQDAGVLRRRLASEGDVVAVGGMLGVIAPAGASGAEIDAFVEAASAQASAAPALGPRSAHVDSELGPLRLVAVGEGTEAAVLLHGFGGDALGWRYNMEALATGRAALAFDLPGHGESTRDVGLGGVEQLAASVGGALETHAPAALHLVGHSMGALVAAEVARRHAERMRSLTLIAPAGFGEDIGREFVDGFVAAGSRREVRAVLELLFAQPALVSREMVEDVLRFKREEGVGDALATLRDALFPDGRQTRSIVDVVGELDVPLLVIWGAEDRVLPARQREAAPPRARVELLEGVGHMPQLEASAEVNRLLAEALA